MVSKTLRLNFLNSLVIISVVFVAQNPDDVRHHKVIILDTSPVNCGHFVLRSPKKSFLNNTVYCIPDHLRLLKAKFHYASCLEAGRRPASNLSATSFEAASVMEFGFYYSFVIE